jgi:hypothetical protein
MSNLEPSYLRYIHDGLVNGSIHPENSAELPEGLIGMYEEAFGEWTSILERQKLLQRFAIWALLKKEVSAAFVAEVLEESEDEIQQFISTYSAWFNSPESGKYQLYHERLKVYLLQKLSEEELEKLLNKIIRSFTQENKSTVITSYAKEWSGFYFILLKRYDLGLNFLIENITNQDENWWLSTFELYCICMFTQKKCQILEPEISFFSKLRGQEQCVLASNLVVNKFEQIPWDEFSHFSHETRFHYVLAEVFNKRFQDLPKDLISNIILDESHFLSYIVAYAWKYNCWVNDKILFSDLIERIRNNGSPYLRILLNQIDGGRLMLNKESILPQSAPDDCWEYVSEDFIDYIQIGRENYLNDYIKDVELNHDLLNKNLNWILGEFDSLHVQLDKLRKSKNDIQKSPYFLKIVEILWMHPAWEIGEIGNNFVRSKLNDANNETERTEIIDWVYELSKNKKVYSISILVFDIISVSEISNDKFKELITSIINWNDAQIRGQLIASSNDFFTNNDESKWLEIFKEVLYKLSALATDIWESQELIDLIQALGNRLTKDEINGLLQSHQILNKIPNALDLEWGVFWKTAESLRKQGIL